MLTTQRGLAAYILKDLVMDLWNKAPRIKFKLSRLKRSIWPKFFFCKGDELHLGDTRMRGHGDTIGSGN
jgi:hypothetical protein